jgi:hypothetical protein
MFTNSGLATGVSGGGSTISATQGQVTRSTTLTIQPAPLSITTTSLPTGTVGASYSVTQAVNGGTQPYTWSITAGFLPGGLMLGSSTGAITGTSTASGTVNFALKVADSAEATQNAIKPLSITIATGAPPLSVTSTTPASGATGVNVSTTVGATFNNALNASTVTLSTFTLTDPNTTPVSGSYTVAGSTATLIPAAALAASTTCTATLTAAIKDVNGSSLASNDALVVYYRRGSHWIHQQLHRLTKHGRARETPRWSGSHRRNGMKFKADSDGTATAIRFYKVSTNTGTHFGHLWSSTGQSLATATFSGETASGLAAGEPVACRSGRR